MLFGLDGTRPTASQPADMSSPTPTQKTIADRPPRSKQRVLMTWAEEDDPSSKTRTLTVSEQYIETKTITTTTTTRRRFSPIQIREPQMLDPKEYPLAPQPTPAFLKHFSSTYTIPEGSPNYSQPWSAVGGTGADGSSSEHRLENVDYTEDPTVKSGGSFTHAFIKRRPQPKGLRRSGSRFESPTNSPLPRTAALLRALAKGPRLPRYPRMDSDYLATPDEAERVSGDFDDDAPSLHLPSTTEAETSQSTAYDDAESQAGSETQTVFSAVATPPVTDAELQPVADYDEPLQQTVRGLHASHAISAVAAQDASLPSPRLSPTLAAAQLQLVPSDDEGADDEGTASTHAFGRGGPSQWLDETQRTGDADAEMVDDSLALSPAQYDPSVSPPQFDGAYQQALMNPDMMIDSFDAMPTQMKSWMIYQLLRRCPRKTLQAVADVVNPALKCDFFRRLPTELSLHVLSYLDHRDLCRAAQVSKQWRNIIDSNETGWKELFDRDGFQLAPGELQKAIAQGWGWQDPVGALEGEVDLSQHCRLTSNESELFRSAAKSEKSDKADSSPTPKIRSSKRKRNAGHSNSERSKRRVSFQDPRERFHQTHRSEGPMSAANAAALAVPDPQIGLPSLRRLHLYKSLYRRHYMIRQNWTSGKVRPSHVAFAAHPRHVITCLQFDEDKIITGSDDTLIHVYDTKTGKLRTKLEGHEGGVWALQYVGNTLVSGSTDRSVRVWDIQKGICTQTFYGHTSTVRCLQILMPTETGEVKNGEPVMMPEKPLIITGSRDSQLRVWRLPEPGSRRYIMNGPAANEENCPYFVRILQGHGHSVRSISAHGDILVSGSYDSTVRVWRISTGQQLHVLSGHNQKVYSVVLDHKRNRCISGSMDSFVKIWDLDTGACLYTLEGHSLLVGLLDLRDEKLVSAAADSTLRIWDPETGKCKHTLMAHTGAITCFQHDGRKVISGSEKTVKMWDVQTGECMQDLLTDLSGVWQVKFDERRCVAAVQRGNLTYVEILDFGAVRDGAPPEELGKRKLLNEAEVQQLLLTEGE
ncbi:WD40-repeat-containing domain protein [Pseudoneurospora amorphoporcata]|uniref:WD40-repeat-containing domain protein n=1 Tax=Pseudoneurospora amorphoporcata TaxID=241081 RepID=A0AAN6P4R6_9PEZI|nr:WD40-repeat-containing domain protein [Pseudoneurospora amorphoporcata]